MLAACSVAIWKLGGRVEDSGGGPREQAAGRLQRNLTGAIGSHEPARPS
jgi:hypothetical protein